jgi:Mn-dependent DtxR family transcriptional regulator
MYGVLMEKQQKSVEMGWIDEKNHVFILVNVAEIGAELNWNESDVVAATNELEKFGLVEMIENVDGMKLYLKRFV